MVNKRFLKQDKKVYKKSEGFVTQLIYSYFILQ